MESKGLDVFDLTIAWSWCASHGGAAIVLFPVAFGLITNFSFKSLLTFSLPINFEKFDWNIAIWSTKVIFYVNFWRQTEVWQETDAPWMVERISKIPPTRRCVRRHQFCICWTGCCRCFMTMNISQNPTCLTQCVIVVVVDANTKPYCRHLQTPDAYFANKCTLFARIGRVCCCFQLVLNVCQLQISLRNR